MQLDPSLPRLLLTSINRVEPLTRASRSRGSAVAEWKKVSESTEGAFSRVTLEEKACHDGKVCGDDGKTDFDGLPIDH